MEGRDAMGLLEEREHTLDASIFSRLAARLRKARIGGAVVPMLAAVARDPALLEQCLDQLNRRPARDLGDRRARCRRAGGGTTRARECSVARRRRDLSCLPGRGEAASRCWRRWPPGSLIRVDAGRRWRLAR
jgi:hypothetical protein